LLRKVPGGGEELFELGGGKDSRG
jgi:hypothetical protein